MLKVAAYARCSLLIVRGQDPENQLTPIREFARIRDFNITKEYVDHISGTADRRPALDQLIKDARSGKFKVILVYALDRLARDVRFLLNLLHELDTYGVHVIFLRESIDFGTPIGKACLAILSAIAQLERDLISERIKTALAVKKITAAKTNNGWRAGRKSLPSATVVKILELSQGGLSIRKIAKQLGVGKTSVERIIKRR